MQTLLTFLRTFLMLLHTCLRLISHQHDNFPKWSYCRAAHWASEFTTLRGNKALVSILRKFPSDRRSWPRSKTNFRTWKKTFATKKQGEHVDKLLIHHRTIIIENCKFLPVARRWLSTNKWEWDNFHSFCNVISLWLLCDCGTYVRVFTDMAHVWVQLKLLIALYFPYFSWRAWQFWQCDH